MQARENLQVLLAGLVRASFLQLVVNYIWEALFWGLAVSCAAVLVVRLGGLPYSPWAAAALCVGLALAIAVGLARRRRSDSLRVAIFSDLAMKLKERVSTACEYAAAGGDPALAERLAVQALKVGHHLKAERLFPLQINARGKLIPFMAALLVFVGIVNLQRVAAPPAPVPDAVVIREGERLRVYGRDMEVRTRREGFQRGMQAARRMQNLGERMEDAGLTRRRALSRLGDLAEEIETDRRAALREGAPQDVGPMEMDAIAASPLMTRVDLQAMLDSLLDGRLNEEDLAPLDSDMKTLSRLGITADDLNRAIKGFSEGDVENLRRILEDLAATQRSLREAEEAEQGPGDRGPGPRKPGRTDQGHEGKDADDAERAPAQPGRRRERVRGVRQ